MRKSLRGQITLYSKPDCHLCERALVALEKFGDVHEIDISQDTDLFKKYFLSIPVVELEGKIIFQASDIKSPGDIETKLENILAIL